MVISIIFLSPESLCPSLLAIWHRLKEQGIAVTSFHKINLSCFLFSEAIYAGATTISTADTVAARQKRGHREHSMHARFCLARLNFVKNFASIMS